MAVKVTFLFHMSTVPNVSLPARVAGWSESWIDNNNPINGNAIRTTALQYARARAAFLPSSAECVGCRFTELGSKASIAFPFSVRGVPSFVTDMPQLALLIPIQARADINHFPFYLRCIPDDAVKGGEFTYGTVATRNILFAIVQWWEFVSTNYRFRGKDLTLPQFEIETIDASGNVELKEAGTLFGVGTKVQILRTQFDESCCGGGGIYKVKAETDAFRFSLSGWTGGAAHGGKVKLKSDLFNYPISGPPTLADVRIRAVEKKVGRPFDLFRGRRSPTCCR